MGRLFAVLVAVAAGYLIMRIGIAMMRAMVRPQPAPPPAGELRRVRLHYRCPQCGMELRITTAPNEDPLPPRHCMDEMDLVATAEE